MNEKWFDWYYIILVILGNWYVFKNFGFKVHKRYVTLILSAVFGALYVYFYEYIIADATVTKADIRVIINSYLLSTSIYELGGKDLFKYLEEKAPGMAKNLIDREAGRLNRQAKEAAEEQIRDRIM